MTPRDSDKAEDICRLDVHLSRYCPLCKGKLVAQNAVASCTTNLTKRIENEAATKILPWLARQHGTHDVTATDSQKPASQDREGLTAS